ncbi:MAG TPA: hypothetical protein PKZ41_06610, partial [Candidatus Omnitrophota bacterium]|nr:hypothetical protein [Candidatus Omnitrophota bacterium]
PELPVPTLAVYEPAGREAEKEALKLYRERYTGVFPADSLKGLKVVFYEHSAVGRDIIAEILEKLGATLIRVSRSDKFVPVDTEKISKETLELLKKWSSEHRPFAIVSTDGDSDRPLVADEKGAFIPGDKLGALAAMYLNPDFAAVPVSANDAVVSALTSRGVKVKQTRIGSPYVVKAMIDEMATSPSSKTVSWESNGGFLLGSAWVFAGKKLKELPTRDAVLPIVTLLMMAKKRGKAISEIVSEDMPARYTDAGVADNGTPGCEKYTAEMGTRIINAFSPARKDILEAVFSKGEVKVPGADISQADKENLKAIKDRLSSYFDRSKGFGEIKNINFVDG